MATTITSSRQYNNRCLYVLTGPCDLSQVTSVLALLVQQFNKLTGQNCYYDINLPVAFDGKPRCCAYIYLSNPSFYYVLIGKNPDGTERMEMIDDPDWVCPEQPTQTVDDLFKKVDDWADIMEEEDKYICPKIPSPLPPLMTIPSVALKPDQVKWMQENESDTDFSTYTIKFSSAFVMNIEPPFIHNMIVCRGIDEGFNHADLRRVFGKYSTSSNKDYPKIDHRQHMATITYDPHTTDGQFAMIMAKKRSFKNKEGKIYHIYCTFFSSDKKVIDKKHKN